MNSHSGYHKRTLASCAGKLTPFISKSRSDNFFPKEMIERYQHDSREIVAIATELYKTTA